ncbi:MAG TPA: glycosyltransferase family 2 protein [Candidatus Portnoybacteria bacterium]|nr:glycosyltransferase family 2 protein [Candidatus Portnoybacteria bacterium]
MLLKNKTSIILTAYNGEKYIREQIESILAQTSKDWELIICEDHSSDSTLKIAEEYADKYDNISIIKNEKNLGLTENFAKGLICANGEFIAVCDVDDYWLPEKIELQLKILKEHKDIGLVYHDVYITDENLRIQKKSSLRKILRGNIFSLHRVNVNKDNLESLIRTNHITAPTIMFRASLKEKILPIPKNSLQDMWIGLIAAAFSKIYFIDKQLIKYRQHGDNMVGIKINGYKYYFKNLFNKNFLSLYRQTLKNYLERMTALRKKILEANKTNLVSPVEQKEKYLKNLIDFLDSQGIIQNLKKFLICAKQIKKSRQTNNFHMLIYCLLYKINPIKF